MSGSKRVSMGETQKAVARECLIYNDTLKKRITETTRLFYRKWHI